METVCFSETLLSTYESTRRHNPEEQHRHPHRRENLRSHGLREIMKTSVQIASSPPKIQTGYLSSLVTLHQYTRQCE
jgi:hypothetical protein